MISRILPVPLRSFFCVSKFSSLIYQNTPQSLQLAVNMLIMIQNQQKQYLSKLKESKEHIIQNQFTENQKTIIELNQEMKRIESQVKEKKKKEINDIIYYGITDMAKEILPVRDSLKQCILELKKYNINSIALNSAQDQFFDAFDQFGIVQIDPIGHKYDPHTQEVIKQIKDLNKEDGTVIQTILTKYTIYGRLLRAAKVVAVNNHK